MTTTAYLAPYNLDDSLHLWQITGDHQRARREILAQYLNIEPNTLIFKNNPHGKPYITGIKFSITHTQNQAYLLIGQGECGVDLESHKNRDFIKLAERYFNPAEITYLKTSPELTQHFYTIWTLKEAYTKAIGRGIAYGFEKFNSLDLQSPWQQHLLHPSARETLAIVYQGSRKKIIHHVYHAK